MFLRFASWFRRRRNPALRTKKHSPSLVRVRTGIANQSKLLELNDKYKENNNRHALLALLEKEPKHPYEMMQALRGKTGSAKFLFPALQQLHDEGLVDVDVDFGWRTYFLTEAGKAELSREAETVKRIWQRAEQAGDWAPWMGMEGAEVMRPAADLMKTALKAATRGTHDAAKIAKIREILERTKREIESLD